MSETPIQLLVAAFQGERTADEALKELKQAKREKLIGIQNAAVLRRGTDGKLRIKELADLGAGKGAVIGAIVGIVVPGIGNLIGAAAGAALGGLYAKLRDTGFSNAHLKDLGEALTPDSSAIVAIIEHRWVNELEDTLEKEGARIFREELKAGLAAELAAGHDAVFSALNADGTTVVAVGSTGDLSEVPAIEAPDSEAKA